MDMAGGWTPKTEGLHEVTRDVENVKGQER